VEDAQPIGVVAEDREGECDLREVRCVECGRGRGGDGSTFPGVADVMTSWEAVRCDKRERVTRGEVLKVCSCSLTVLDKKPNARHGT
jgi:hypothetical protein